MILAKILDQLPGIQNTNGELNIEISSLAHDSRSVAPASLFIAMRGLLSDGHNYIDDAIESGAVALVYDRPDIPISSDIISIRVDDSRQALAALAANFYEHPETKLDLIGITGTNGKTTCNYFIQHLLNAGRFSTGRVGTTGASLGELEIDLVHTTPESIDLYSILNSFVQADAKAATLEVSSHALAQHRVDGLVFKIAIFTNLTQDHLDYHDTFEDYLAAKQLLFTGLSPEAIAIINSDDPHSEKMISSCEARIIRYGYGPDSDYCISRAETSNRGIKLYITTPKESLEVYVNTIGKYNTYNFLAVFAAALELGCDAHDVVNAAANLSPAPGRLEMMVNKAPFKVFVDYAHTPDAMQTVLQTLSESFPSNRLITVFGCGGDRDKGKRPIMGEIASRLSTLVIITDDNPRSELPMDIIKAIETGCTDSGNYNIIQNRSKAIQSALNEAGPEDVVAILGKGHEPYQEIRGERIPYSDMNVVNDFMEQHAYSS